MSLLSELRERFAPVLAEFDADAGPWLEMIRPSQDSKFGDYQANFAMALGKKLGRPPRELAADIAARVNVADLCEPPEVAGPGFINLRFGNAYLVAKLAAAVNDAKLGIAVVKEPRKFVVDYSSPNVAKPMHVGHIRSTVIGDAICRTLRFLGHQVISDNHIGDWGTQFGMIIYGYKHFVDAEAYSKSPVLELARLYRLVRQLVGYREAQKDLPKLQDQWADKQHELQALEASKPDEKADKKTIKHAREAMEKLRKGMKELQEELDAAGKKIAAVDGSPELAQLAAAHAGIAQIVLAETAKLHSGDAENLRLWREFMPACLEEINRLYRRLDVTFEHVLGESFYHDLLAGVVEELLDRGIAQRSEGAVCVFVPGQPAPMIVQKQDGAFLYATTDLATIRYRVDQWKPDAILYVVDHRQSLHFEQLFAVGRMLWGDKIDFRHVSFGTVLGEDGRPFQTRAGDTVGLEGLIDKAIEQAEAVIEANEATKPDSHKLAPADRAEVAKIVGISALKYADLSQNRTSDYEFSYAKMLAMTGNTATYIQYSYARVQSIFTRGDIDIATLRASDASITLENPTERDMALELLRFAEALDTSVVDFHPNHLTAYLFSLANRYSTFFVQCPVLKADTPALRDSRLLLCDLTARTIRTGLELLGIRVAEKM
jgi:arginyl-tRNA synthetase